jgi:hypothetical protein
MKRTPLLIETLVTKQITRPGPIYMYRRPMGPRPPTLKGEKLNRFLHKVGQHFDFAPLMNGDQQQARQIAGDYYKHVLASARQEGISEEEIKRRLKDISPHLRRGLMTFFTYFDAKLKTT